MSKRNFEVAGSVITKAQVWWPSLTAGQENKMNKDKPYTVDFVFVDKRAELEKLGVSFSEVKSCGVNKGQKHDSGSAWFCSKSKFPYENIFKMDRTKMTAEEISKIGNGTEVTVKINVIKGNGDYGPYVAASLNQMVVTKLVEYTATPDGPDAELFDGIDGDLNDDVDELFSGVV